MGGAPTLKTKSVKFNFIMNMILTASSFIFPLITFPYVSRVLLVEGNGYVSFATSVLTYFTMFPPFVNTFLTFYLVLRNCLNLLIFLGFMIR